MAAAHKQLLDQLGQVQPQAAPAANMSAATQATQAHAEALQGSASAAAAFTESEMSVASSASAAKAQIAALERGIRTLTGASDRIGLSNALGEDEAIEKLDVINAKIEQLTAKRDQLQLGQDLSSATPGQTGIAPLGVAPEMREANQSIDKFREKTQVLRREMTAQGTIQQFGRTLVMRVFGTVEDIARLQTLSTDYAREMKALANAGVSTQDALKTPQISAITGEVEAIEKRMGGAAGLARSFAQSFVSTGATLAIAVPQMLLIQAAMQLDCRICPEVRRVDDRRQQGKPRNGLGLGPGGHQRRRNGQVSPGHRPGRECHCRGHGQRGSQDCRWQRQAQGAGGAMG